ncbi:uncharacterized protein LOC128854023 [Cuculus canorus]|uniref:uncharacterized protein LOC128854023 n=1 Tax=Cuculus canorus TaxID=55661 RepID=UPI0023AA9E4E|nr:uncharacterized protein LOC128854023 [Cuculus canorus]
MLTCQAATHSAHRAPTQPVRPVQHLLLPRAGAPRLRQQRPCESERSLAPPRSRVDGVSLETLSRIDSLSQCSRLLRPLDPAGRTWRRNAFGTRAATQQSPPGLGSILGFPPTPKPEIKVAFSKGATGPANIGKHWQTLANTGKYQRSFSRAGWSLLPPTAQDTPQVQRDGLQHGSSQPETQFQLDFTHHEMAWEGWWEEMGGRGWGETSVALPGALPAVFEAAGLIEHNILPPPSASEYKGSETEAVRGDKAAAPGSSYGITAVTLSERLSGWGSGSGDADPPWYPRPRRMRFGAKAFPGMLSSHFSRKTVLY